MRGQQGHRSLRLDGERPRARGHGASHTGRTVTRHTALLSMRSAGHTRTVETILIQSPHDGVTEFSLFKHGIATSKLGAFYVFELFLHTSILLFKCFVGIPELPAVESLA